MIARPKMKLNQPINIWFAILSVLIVMGLTSGIIVLVQGLSVTNLTDLIPWGLWIAIDLSSIALAAGAFSFCAAVYLLKLKELEPMARTAAFIGLIGYTMAMMCLFLDIGRPERFWHGFAFWNTHSVLWEVTMCVGLYFSVLLLENLPTIANLSWLKNKWPKLTEKMASVHHYAPYLAVAGLALSMLHQSSLGAMYGVIAARPIWYRPGLAVLFFISAMAGGVAMTTLATLIVGRIKKGVNIKKSSIEKVLKFLGWLLVGYLYLRFWDLFAMTYTYQPGKAEGLKILTSGPLSFNLWFGELLLGTLVPILLLFNSKTRKNEFFQILAVLLVVGGVIAYRWDTNMVGQLIVQKPILNEFAPLYAQYSPSLIEIGVGAGIIAFGLMAFTIGVKYLKVVDHNEGTESSIV
ncbi:MAG: polysulfide reductase NrfD [Chloroflexi bacterium]|jgi:Ni/Fe-hydrogenase subunit HybB-like protein|nr:polysulfide reductase NrfD [Chloroflexota bacterium]MBT4004281.1 polysulfide reductase NrfD [Chloroflexota bacterium]MBT4305722.1 polysulfide reductase NrfD [Chloroflexota bacterium]MBT4533546.1 polysulfide reductase NrfD [Chloroflexota bacterium]MBT4681811.1 polysulfide reductase NrfD [Chloroflexota bacterium]